MGTYVNGSNGVQRPQLPAGDAIVPGLNLSWSSLMLIVDDFSSNGGAGEGGENALFALPKPAIDIGGLTGELQDLQNKYIKYATDGQKTMLQLHRDQRRDSMNAAIKAIQTFVDNTLKAIEDQKKESVGAWCKAVFGLIGAVLAAVCITGLSGGAAVAAGAAVVLGAVMALLDTVNQAVHTAGVKGPDGKEALDISIAAGMKAIIDNQSCTKDLSAEDRAKRVSDATTGVTVVLTLLVIAGGLAAAEGLLVPAAKAMNSVCKGKESATAAWSGFKQLVRERADDVAGQLELTAEVLTQVADAATAAADITIGSFKIRVAGAELDANNARSSGDLWNAIAQYVARYVERDGSDLKDAMGRYSRMQSDIFDMIKDYFSAQREVFALS